MNFHRKFIIRINDTGFVICCHEFFEFTVRVFSQFVRYGMNVVYYESNLCGKLVHFYFGFGWLGLLDSFVRHTYFPFVNLSGIT